MPQIRTALLVLLLLAVAAPLAMHWIRADPSAWYRPHMLWIGIVLLIAWINRRHATDDT